MNKVILVGNVGKAPTLVTTQSGTPLLKFSVAVKTRKPGDGPQWFSIAVFGKRAVTLSPFLTQGAQVYVEGPVSVSTYQSKDGQTRASLDVLADDVQVMSSARETLSEWESQPAALDF